VTATASGVGAGMRVHMTAEVVEYSAKALRALPATASPTCARTRQQQLAYGHVALCECKACGCNVADSAYTNVFMLAAHRLVLRLQWQDGCAW
jgi:ribosomal protein L37AE/L43A